MMGSESSMLGGEEPREGTEALYLFHVAVPELESL